MSATSSNATTPSSKVSRFAANSRFVIPKNKLSGSLVPIARGSKNGASDAVAEEGTKQVQRKSNWGPDLTQDASVKKGRALAYQIRVEQIKQLLSGTLGTEDIDASSESTHQVMDDRPLNYKLEKKASKQLELERREAIAEILKLDPSYKAPADYKPLQKEAKVPIPIKEHPGYDFLGLMFGPVNDTQKRLEKETGAKLRIFGTKTGTREKVEVTSSEVADIHKVFDELHVHISSDTYEKVDAAVALIELLVTPVSANPASVSSTTTAEESVHASPLNANETPMPPSVGLTGQPNLVSNNPLQVSSLPYSMPSIFASSGPQNSSFFPTGPQQPPPPLPQHLLRPYLSQQTPRNPFVVFTHIVPTQFSGNQSRPIPVGTGSGTHPQPPMSILHPRLPMVSPTNQPTFSPVNRPISVVLPLQSGIPSISSGNAPTFNATKLFVTAPPRPQQRSSNDFTFQTNNNRPHILSPSPSPQAGPGPGPQRIYTQQPLSPRPNISIIQLPPRGSSNPSINPALHNPNHGFPRPPPPQHRTQMPTPIIAQPGPLRHAIYPNPGSPHMPLHLQNLRPMQMQEVPRQRFLAPNHSFSFPSIERPPPAFMGSSRGGQQQQQQFYDPFSPTAVPPPNPQSSSRRAVAKTEKQESDPEYEDLMASVGVK